MVKTRKSKESLRLSEKENCFIKDPPFQIPLMNIIEDKKSLKFFIKIPGFSKEIDNTILREEKEKKKGEYLQKEFNSKNHHTVSTLIENIELDEIGVSVHNGILEMNLKCSFKRCFNLPKNVKEEIIGDNFVNGILSLIIPKRI